MTPKKGTAQSQGYKWISQCPKELPYIPNVDTQINPSVDY